MLLIMLHFCYLEIGYLMSVCQDAKEKTHLYKFFEKHFLMNTSDKKLVQRFIFLKRSKWQLFLFPKSQNNNYIFAFAFSNVVSLFKFI